MARKTSYTIRKRDEGWQVNLSPRVTSGKRVQKNYKTKANAGLSDFTIRDYQ